MNANTAFSAGGTVTLAATSASSRVALAAGSAQRLHNAGTTTAFVRFGDSSVVATTADMPVPPGLVEIQTVAGTHMAAITATGTANLFATGGEGI